MSSRAAAERHAQNIRDYWLEQGYRVPVEVKRVYRTPHSYDAVLPEFQNGLPPESMRIPGWKPPPKPPEPRTITVDGKKRVLKAPPKGIK